MAELDELCRIAVEAAANGEQLEAYAEWGRTTNVHVYNAEVESLTSAEARGLGVRIVTDGRVGYAYSADPDPAEIKAVVEQARTNAKLSTADEANVLPDPQKVDPLDGIFFPDIARMPAADKVSLALDIERMCKAEDERITGVEDASYGDAVSRVALASTTGIQLWVERADCWAVVSALASADGETQTGFSFELGRRPGDLDLARIAREGAERATRLLGSRKPKSERMPVVLDQNSAASFLGVLAAGLTAEAVVKGRSLFADKVSERVGSDVVTLVDDGRELKGPGATPFDDEGVPTGRTALIERGVLNGFLHNTYTARRMGTRSTGNAGRAGFKSTPGVSTTNLFLVPGAGDQKALLKQAGRALLVQDLIGVHSGANPISGDFSVGVTGLICEGGEFKEPIREAAVASTILEILAGIVAVGDDLRFFGGTGSPSVLVGEMTVAGA
jgi:PmbA protein